MIRIFFAMTAAFFAAGVVSASDVPVVPGKGTIGLVCLDSAGVAHFWTAQEQSDFNGCLDQVVRAWSVKNDSSGGQTSQASFDEMIQGMAAYRQAVDKAFSESASHQRKPE